MTDVIDKPETTTEATPEKPTMATLLRALRRADHKLVDEYAVLHSLQEDRRNAYLAIVEAWAAAGKPLGTGQIWSIDDGDLSVTFALDNHQELRIDFAEPLAF